jgi:hypothetical protein
VGPPLVWLVGPVKPCGPSFVRPGGRSRKIWTARLRQLRGHVREAVATSQHPIECASGSERIHQSARDQVCGLSDRAPRHQRFSLIATHCAPSLDLSIMARDT